MQNYEKSSDCANFSRKVHEELKNRAENRGISASEAIPRSRFRSIDSDEGRRRRLPSSFIEGLRGQIYAILDRSSGSVALSEGLRRYLGEGREVSAVYVASYLPLVELTVGARSIGEEGCRGVAEAIDIIAGEQVPAVMLGRLKGLSPRRIVFELPYSDQL